MVIPDISLVDPHTAVTMPPDLTAATGMDALCHAFEAYVSTASSPLTDMAAYSAVELVMGNLMGAFTQPLKMAFRNNMMMADLMAGLAFSNASLGLVHAMAHSLGGALGLAHGECNAILLEEVVRYNYGEKVGNLLGRENYEKLKHCIRGALSGELVHYEDAFAVAKDDIQWLDITYVPDADDKGEVIGFYVLEIDSTARKRAEEALQYRDTLLREIGSIVKIGGWEFDPATGEGTWTDEVARIYDLDPDQDPSVEKGIRFFQDEARERVESAVKEASERGTPYDLTLELISAKGRRKWVRTIGRPKLEEGRVVQVRGSFQDVTKQVLVQQEILASEERFRLLVESAPDAVFVQTHGCFAYLNSAAVKFFGAESAEQLIGTPVLERFHPGYRDRVAERIRKLNDEKKPVPTLHEVCLQLDGTPVDIEASAIAMKYEGSDGALVFARDISDRIRAEKEQKKLQDQLHQAQKMESVGRLAGGVAHDYNNFLSVIIGYTELSMISLDRDDELYKNLQQVLNAANRSKAITRQLLAFARKEEISPEVLDLNTTVENMLKMIRRLIGEDTELAWLPGVRLWPVEMDPSQIDQILANLCINARDAMESNGRIVIETGKASIDEAYCFQHPDSSQGDFVTLSVSDNGSGIDKETLNIIFEPFYTTKGMDKGTGLGLSTVYGIVKQNNGFIKVYSEPEKGTLFKVYLPRYRGELREGFEAVDKKVPEGKGERILVVEDDSSILKLTEKILQRFGYEPLIASSPAKALELARAQDEEIDLLITDVIMPKMNGRELVEALKAIFPKLKYLYMSGYTADVIAHSGVLEHGVNFIQKPFSSKDLAAKIREVIA